MFRTLKTKMFLFLFSVSQEQNSEFCVKRCFYWSSSLSRHLHCPYYKVNELEKLWFHLCFWQEHTQMHTGNSSQYLQSRGLCFNFFNYQWTVFIPLCVCVCVQRRKQTRFAAALLVTLFLWHLTFHGMKKIWNHQDEESQFQPDLQKNVR